MGLRGVCRLGDLGMWEESEGGDWQQRHSEVWRVWRLRGVRGWGMAMSGWVGVGQG